MRQKAAMKKNRFLLFCLICGALFFPVACTLSEPLAEDYYAGVSKIGGGNPPSVPVVTFTAATLRFDFSASIDPESGGEVGTYYIYIYNGVPDSYYGVRDIARTISPPDARTFYYVGQQSGTHTAVVTGYDGYRESAVTNQNKIVFSFP